MPIDLSVSSLKTKISNAGGLQRNNKFYIELYNNNADLSILKTNNVDNDGTQKGYYAEDVVFPNISMTTQADNLSGPGFGRLVPRGMFYREGLIITFPVMGDWNIVKDIDKWMKSMYYYTEGNPSVWVTEYYNEVAQNGKLKVYALDLNGNTKATYEFFEAYPIEMVPLRFSHIATNEYLKIQARFLFREYTLS